ncbi:MAG: histidine phosphatase family protein [Alphaproteobacteria bacterium]|nr:histidine phosphatase family protein [Alphaproteobacteria bacterium]
MPKTLYILRHAKAEVGLPTQDDFDRALAPRGVSDAATLAAHMAKNHLLPELVWCSSAVRTRQTLASMQENFTAPPPAELKDKLYNASAGEILTLLSSAPEEVSSLMVIAHNPGVHQLALKLAKTGDDKHLDTLAIKYPTCSLTVVEFANAAWRDLAVSHGKLVELITPKMLGGVDD